MLVFRSLALGLAGACLLLLAFRPAYVVRLESAPAPPVATAGNAATLVDIGPAVAPQQVAALIHLAPGEHVVDIDDHPVAGDLDAGAALASHVLQAGSYIDLTVAGAFHTRRILVLVH